MILQAVLEHHLGHDRFLIAELSLLDDHIDDPRALEKWLRKKRNIPSDTPVFFPIRWHNHYTCIVMNEVHTQSSFHHCVCHHREEDRSFRCTRWHATQYQQTLVRQASHEHSPKSLPLSSSLPYHKSKPTRKM